MICRRIYIRYAYTLALEICCIPQVLMGQESKTQVIIWVQLPKTTVILYEESKVLVLSHRCQGLSISLGINGKDGIWRLMNTGHKLTKTIANSISKRKIK